MEYHLSWCIVCEKALVDSASIYCSKQCQIHDLAHNDHICDGHDEEWHREFSALCASLGCRRRTRSRVESGQDVGKMDDESRMDALSEEGDALKPGKPTEEGRDKGDESESSQAGAFAVLATQKLEEMCRTSVEDCIRSVKCDKESQGDEKRSPTFKKRHLHAGAHGTVAMSPLAPKSPSNTSPNQTEATLGTPPHPLPQPHQFRPPGLFSRLFAQGSDRQVVPVLDSAYRNLARVGCVEMERAVEELGKSVAYSI